MLTEQTYPATRATPEEMEARARFLIDYALSHCPVTVRQLFYAATVKGVIEKTENGYEKVQTQVLTRAVEDDRGRSTRGDQGSARG